MKAAAQPTTTADGTVAEAPDTPEPDAAAKADQAERKFKATGHGWGLVASACTTLTGVFGQLATLLVMVITADGTEFAKWFLGVCVCAAAAFVALYAVRFVRGALGAACDAAAAPASDAGVLAPLATSSAAGL